MESIFHEGDQWVGGKEMSEAKIYTIDGKITPNWNVKSKMTKH